MIYLFTGDDTTNRNKAYLKSLKDFKDLPLIQINKNNFSIDAVESLYSDANLFDPKSVIVFSYLLEDKKYSEFILNKLEFFNSSKNVFIFLENKLLKPVIDEFKKYKSEIFVFELKKEAKEVFNNFLLANAFVARDKVLLWLYFRQATEKGVSLEELVGVLFWKVKDMILNKNFLKYKENELLEIAHKLSILLPKSRKEGKEAEITFEKFLLEVL
jgi:hypothetical protein